MFGEVFSYPLPRLRGRVRVGADQILAIFTLTVLEIVLGIDNIIFITLLVNKLPEALQKKARVIGLSLAMCTRIALLCSLSWMASLTTPLYPSLFDFSARDLILIFGGSFLIYKALSELISTDQVSEKNPQVLSSPSVYSRLFWLTMGQIALIDILFSLDSVITAVGLVNQIPIMISAIIISVFIMMFALKPISDFLDTHPSYKALALYFLVIVGAILVLEGFNVSVPKSYLYTSLGLMVLAKNLKKLFSSRTLAR